MKNQKRYRVWLGLLLATALVSGWWLNDPRPILADSTIFHVAPSGQDAPTCGAQAAPCETIQYAVNMASSGDTIKVAEGVYTFVPEHDVCTGRIAGSSAVVCYIDKELTILGGYTTSNWNSANPAANPTIVDGKYSHRGVRLQKSYTSAPTVSLQMQGFTVRNCLAIGASSGTDDETNAFGAGLLSEHASVSLEDMVFSNNEARGGTTAAVGGAGAGGAVAVLTTWGGVSINFSNITFTDNRAIGGDGQDRGGPGIGGGLFTYGITASGENLTFLNNLATGGSTATGDGVADGERADAQGAAAAFHGGTNATMQAIVASDNVARGGDAPQGEAGGAYGGGLYAENSSLSLYDATVGTNQAIGGNGRNTTDWAAQAWGGGLGSFNSNLTLSRVQIMANVARGGNGAVYGGAVAGGGVAAVSTTSALRQITIENTIVADNEAYMGTGQTVGGGGGGLWFYGVDADLTHTTIANNHIQQNLLGQAVVVVAGGVPATVDIANSIISDHTGLVNTAALHVQTNTSVNLSNNLFTNNTVNDNHDRMYVGAPGAFTGLSTNIAVVGPVGYVAPGAHDYHLTRGSAARDLVPTIVLNLDVDQQSRKGVADLGADEYIVPIDLRVRPLGIDTLEARWQIDAQYMASDINHYRLALSCQPGAASPSQVRCGSHIDLDLGDSSLVLTDLTEYMKYTMTMSVVDQYGNVIETSESATAFPTDHFVFVPLVLR